MRYRLTWVTLLALLLVTACRSGTASDNTPKIELIAISTPFTAAQQPTSTPTQQPPTPSGPITVSVWWPESLAPSDNISASELLTGQITAFENSTGNVLVQRRVKRLYEAGGILSTLRTASAVAPGALPDLTLIRREDLLTAVEAHWIQPLEGLAASAIVGDLSSMSNSVLQLGQVDGQLYGIPYMLEVQHLAYRMAGDDETRISWRFEDFLQLDTTFLFPGANSTRLSDVFYAQYLAAGGTPPENGTLSINQNALETVLSFYEQAAEAGLIDSSVLNYTRPSDYYTAFANGSVDVAVLDSTLFLRMSGSNLNAISLPTDSGESAAVLNGWMWVMVTPNAERQAMAIQFLNWMMSAERQGEYAGAIGTLPSQRSALRVWGSPDANQQALIDLVADAVLPLSANEAGSAARAIQTAFVSVINGERTAEEAAQAVMEQIGQAN